MRDRLIEAFRGLLGQTPSIELFDTLCDELDGSPEPDPDVLAYVTGHLERWPDTTTREAPARWAARIARGEPVTAASVCDTLAFDEIPEIDELPESCRGVRHLSFAYVPHGALANLARSAHRVRTLDVRYTTMNDVQFGELVACTNLAGLTSLHAQGNALTRESAHALAEATHMTSLRVLDLRHNVLGPVGARALANAPTLSSLELLRLSRDDVFEEGARELASSRTLSTQVTSWWSAVERRHARHVERRGW